VKKHLKLTKRKYGNAQDFIDRPVEGDYVVCGSDQIWNLQITKGLDPVYLLDFPSTAGKKIAYAVSMGETDVPDELKKEFREAALKIDRLSVRERFTRDQLVSCGYSETISLVLDPTLLPVQFPAFVAEEAPAEPYIAMYYVAGDEEIGKAALRLKKILHLPIVNLSSSRFEGADKNELFLDPGKWLQRIRGAAVVCTNSFHGTALSVKFNRPFYVITARKHVGWPGNRMSELLSSLELEHRILNSSDEVPESREEILEGVDYKKAMELLGERQIRSLDFLRRSLGSGETQESETKEEKTPEPSRGSGVSSYRGSF